MATLELKVGALTATATATDENATRVLQGALKNAGYDLSEMTGQEQASVVVDLLVAYIQKVSLRGELDEAERNAKTAVATLEAELADAKASLANTADPIMSDPPTFNGA